MEKQPWTYEQILDLFAETDKKFEASNKELNRKFEASNKAMDKKFDELRKFIKNVSRQVGEITDTLGRFAEEQISPRVLEFFQERGIDLREVYQRVVVKDEHQQFLMELDLLLVNGEQAVVVEVKHKLKQVDVEEHLRRMDKLIDNPMRATRGLQVMSAVAGMIVSSEVANFAMQKGLYVIKPKGNSVEVINPPDFKAKTWKIKD